jgi:beta-galactosidase/beta-glucuronidase
MDWLRAEAARIFDDYGNHPSLVLFSLGNELEGTYLFQQQLVREFKARDSRCLYTTCSNRLWVADALEKSGRADRPPETDDSNFRRSHQQVRIFQKARAVWNQPGDLGRLSLGIRQSGQGRLHLH